MPELDIELGCYWEAFWQLHRLRNVGFGVGPIAAAEINAWCEIHGVNDTEARSEFFRLITAMDAEFLDWNAVSRESNKAK